MVTVKRTTNSDKDFQALIVELDKDLQGRYGAAQQEYDQYNKVSTIDTVVVVYHENKPVGCGCFKEFDDQSVELKRMFVAEDQRGKGIGAGVIKELEDWARELGYKYMVLETGTKQTEAIHLYQKKGYAVTPKYGQYVDMEFSICMKKAL